ncbi:MAG TPA: DnaA regulatory inactivator Hda [Xanthomonadales bacterium]|nr:DnaA regulatory inactivator Hda [Xanthomonadales bacterium]
MTTPQLPLGLRFPAHQRFEAFVAGDNAAAIASVEHAARERGAPWVFVSGPEGSGKTHLLIAACQAAGDARVQYLPLGALAASADGALSALDDFELVCVDDVQAIAGNRAAEVALFDAFNRGRARGATMLFAGRQPAARLPLSLPDLASRLSSCVQAVLKPLDEPTRRHVLRERALARGVELDDAVLDFLFRRHSRDLGSLFELLDRLDRESLAQQRRVTVPFLRRIIGLPSRE